MVHLDFKATNNMAEYEALLYGLSTALLVGVRQLLVKGDSQLIIRQVRGECCCNDPQLVAYLLCVRELEKDFEILDLRHIPRAENAMADDLSAKASTSAPVPDGVLERWLHQPTARTADPSEGGGVQHLEAGSPGGPGSMEPAKDRRHHGRLRVSRRARSRSSSWS
jgi:ribonuclease HI